MAKKKKSEVEEEPKATKEIKTLDELAKVLLEKSKVSHISRLSTSEIANINRWVLSPSYDFNRLLSGDLFRGIPERNFVFLVGPEASFKSSFSALTAAEAQRQGFKIIVIDTEGTWTTQFVERWGLDPEEVLYIYCPWIDEVLVHLGRIYASKMQNLFVVLDSIGNLEKHKVIADALKGDVKADQGGLQRDIKKALKELQAIAKTQASITIGTGHYYGNPTGYGAPEQIGGGKHVRIAADIIVSLKKETKDEVGTEILATTLKNRFYPPFQEAHIEIDYKKGINPYSGLLLIAREFGIFKLEGSWYEFLITGKKFQGAANFRKFLEESGQKDNFLKTLNDYIATTGYSNINENVKQAQLLLENEVKKQEDKEDNES